MPKFFAKVTPDGILCFRRGALFPFGWTLEEITEINDRMLDEHSASSGHRQGVEETQSEREFSIQIPTLVWFDTALHSGIFLLWGWMDREIVEQEGAWPWSSAYRHHYQTRKWAKSWISCCTNEWVDESMDPHPDLGKNHVRKRIINCVQREDMTLVGLTLARLLTTILSFYLTVPCKILSYQISSGANKRGFMGHFGLCGGHSLAQESFTIWWVESGKGSLPFIS